jgi:hypothetical protein
MKVNPNTLRRENAVVEVNTQLLYQTPDQKPGTLNPEPFTLHPKPWTLNSRPLSLYPENRNPKTSRPGAATNEPWGTFYTLNPRPFPQPPTPLTLKSRGWRYGLGVGCWMEGVWEHARRQVPVVCGLGVGGWGLGVGGLDLVSWCWMWCAERVLAA